MLSIFYQKYFESIGEVEIDHELQPEGLERHWHRLMMAHQDRMSALESEVHRLERLQRLAEKLHRFVVQLIELFNNYYVALFTCKSF